MKTGGFSFVEKEKAAKRERLRRKKEGKKERRKEGKKERRKEGKKLCWQKGRGLWAKKFSEREFEVRALFQRGGTFGEEKLFEDEKSGEILGKEKVG